MSKSLTDKALQDAAKTLGVELAAPCLTRSDVRDGGSVDVELSRDGRMCKPLSQQFSDNLNAGSSQLGCMAFLSPFNAFGPRVGAVSRAPGHPLRLSTAVVAVPSLEEAVFYRVLHVADVGAIFKITRAVVGLGRVFVVHFLTFRAITNKRFRDQYVHVAGNSVAGPIIKIYALIALLVWRWFKDAANEGGFRRSGSFDSAEIGNCVKAKPIDGFPYFVRKFFSGKLSAGHAAYSKAVSGMARPVRLFPQSFGPFCILAQ